MNDVETQKFKDALNLALEAFAEVSGIHCHQYLIAETAIGMVVEVWVDDSKHCHVCIEGDSPRQALVDVMNVVQRKF